MTALASSAKGPPTAVGGTSVDDAVRGAATRLAAALANDPGASTPRREAMLLLCHVSGASQAALMAWPERVLAASDHAAFDALVSRRCAGYPMAYLLGSAPFLDFDLDVTPDVLVPRADTEVLVVETLARLPRPARCADLGTGSGAIAIALARAGHTVIATDASETALGVARRNAARCDVGGSVSFAHGSWFEALGDARFDAIVSNPPYVAADDPHLAALSREPRAALVAADDGRADLERLVVGASAHLEPGGWLALEHGADQGAWLRERMQATGYVGVDTARDLAGLERATSGRFASR